MGSTIRRSAMWGWVFAVVIALFAATTASGQSSKLAKDLQDLPSSQAVDVVIQYYSPPTTTSATLVKSVGGTNGQALGLIKGNKYNLTAAGAASLIGLDSNVKYISPDRPVAGSMDKAGPAVNADLVQNLGLDGSGVGIAVIDSGVNPIPDLGVAGSKSSRIVYSQNFDPSTKSTNDIYGHGTHVAVIIAGNGTSSTCAGCSTTFKGIAPKSAIINLRALNGAGTATDSSVIAAIQQAIALKNQYNIRVINLSLGRPIYESYTVDPLCQAVEQAWKAGIVVVVAAGNYGRDNSNGNNGYGTITAPGNDPYAITVGAMKTMGTPSRSDDLIATYSSKGPSMIDHVVKPDIVAPGNLIVSGLASTNTKLYSSYPANLLPASTYTTETNTSMYYRLSGTSMATPVVSGAVALLLQKNPALTPDQVKARLMKTANKTFPVYSTYVEPSTGASFTSYYDIFTVGAGYLDVAAALNNTDLAPAAAGSALSPTAAYDSATNTVYLVNGSSVVWGTTLVWGTSVVWGTTVIWGTNTTGQSVLNGSSMVWGTATNSAFSVIWGTTVIWGTKTNSDAMSVAIGGDR